MSGPAMFRSVSQALHFAWLMIEFEASPDSVMAKMIRRRLEELGKFEGKEISSVDLSGLSALEVRGQCAMIRLAVEALLPGPEGWAIKAKYGQTKVTRDAEGKKTVRFPGERLAAMRSLCAYFAPQFSGMSLEALSYLIARAVAECDELRPSFRAIEEETGINHETLRRKYRDVANRIRVLLDMGVSRLEPIFVREGIVPEGAEV